MTGGASPRRRGDRFERTTKANLERHGWLCVRCPGSGSGADGTPLEATGVDLLAIRRGHVPLLVSCKLGGRVPASEVNALCIAAARYGAIPLLASSIARGVIGYRRLDTFADWSHNNANAAT